MAARRVYGKIKQNALLPEHLLQDTLTKVPPTSSSLYPPIVASLTAKTKASKRRRLEEHYKRVHALTNIPEKLKLINGLQRLKYVVYPQTFALNADRWYQHFTKTVYRPGLPETGTSIGATTQGTPWDQDQLKALVCEALLQEYFYAKKGRTYLYRTQEVSAAPFLTSLASILSTQCAKYNPVLLQSSLDVKPEVNFYWLRGETKVPRGHRKGCIDPVRFQIDDKPLVQIRIPKALPELVPLDSVVPEEVPVINHEPSRLPLFSRQYENKVYIGSQVEDLCKFGHTQIHLVPDRFTRLQLEKRNLADQIEVFLRSNAIASLFAWTGAQAMYQGFWSHADVTQPFVSQAIISDGKYFSFFCYQLNTLALTVDSDVNNSRKNICWGTQSTPLYETVEGDNIKGFNDDVFKQLVNFFLSCSN
ncbi:large ribosomal subunit protein mL65 [Pelobates fuscus]|uniref:large ribosomal subunit protein mL65 n=1 Tax=Pelobates fuscus TaxID=191477 RepID=UPI002FE4418D